MRIIILAVISILIICSCQSTDYSPKPRGYHRIIFPEKEYVSINSGCPYSFEIPKYGSLNTDDSKTSKPCWKNLDFPQFNARLHISYFDINASAPFTQLTEDARTFVFKHTSKATSIEQKKINDIQNNVYGLEYFIDGNTASNYQFYVSDSTKHYLRASLYFNEKPHVDSIQPVLAFLRTDIEHLIKTIRWK